MANILKFLVFAMMFLLLWQHSIISTPAFYEESHETGQNTQITLKAGNVEVSFIDNSAYGQFHRAGYNGISEFRHAEQDSTIFVPLYAGFNLEHVFGGDSLAPFFEPRINDMALKKISDYEVELHQEELPESHLESWTNFKLVEPHYIDIVVKYIIHEGDFFNHGYAAMFWASYIHLPTDLAINFMGKDAEDKENEWIKATSAKHGESSTHKQENDRFDMFAADNFNVRLAANYSDYSYSEPFYYGRFRNMALAYMFDVPTDQILRFAQSPSGGGKGCPAWDYYIVTPDFEVGKEYTFKVRMIYKPFESAEDILDEYKEWIDG